MEYFVIAKKRWIILGIVIATVIFYYKLRMDIIFKVIKGVTVVMYKKKLQDLES